WRAISRRSGTSGTGSSSVDERPSTGRRHGLAAGLQVSSRPFVTFLQLNNARGASARRWAQKLGDTSQVVRSLPADPRRQATADCFHWRVPARLTAWLRSRRSLTWWPASFGRRRKHASI